MKKSHIILIVVAAMAGVGCLLYWLNKRHKKSVQAVADAAVLSPIDAALGKEKEARIIPYEEAVAIVEKNGGKWLNIGIVPGKTLRLQDAKGNVFETENLSK